MSCEQEAIELIDEVQDQDAAPCDASQADQGLSPTPDPAEEDVWMANKEENGFQKQVIEATEGIKRL